MAYVNINPPLAGFSYTEPYEIFVPDLMHVVWKGLAYYIIGWEERSLLRKLLPSNERSIKAIIYVVVDVGLMIALMLRLFCEGG